jgi:hypothetical protein
MKRVLTILAILLLPLSVWAMTPVTDSDLSNVTGQAGVSINQDVIMNIHMGVMAWGDTDGLGLVGIGSSSNVSTGLNPWSSVTTGGYIGIENFDMTVQVKARDTDTYNGYNPLGYPGLRPLTIDVATTATGQDPNLYGTGVTFVRIGLGAMEIDVSAMQFQIGLGTHTGVTASTAPVLNEVLGTVSMGNIGIFINPAAYVDIYSSRGTAAGVEGVSFGIHMIIDQFNMDYISWGDTDGFTNTEVAGQVLPWASTTTAGYIGLQTLRVGGPITITGTVNIDVGTVTSGYYAEATSVLTGGRSNTLPVVHITFGNMSTAGGGYAASPAVSNGIGLEVDVPSIMANVALSNSANLLNTTLTAIPSSNVLGDIYISNFKFQIAKGSWVDIFAH